MGEVLNELVKNDENEEYENVLAENEYSEPENSNIDFENKRKMLESTKIVKQIWSIQEMYQKFRSKKLVLDPDYQRNLVWKDDKKVSFIESLFMGILVPPIYVVEMQGKSILDENTYEIVDGKQRVSSIIAFLEGKLKLTKKYLEYYGDIFANKNFNEISSNGEYAEFTKNMLSSVLDIYVITANSPEFTKYDIFSRLNRGAEPLRIDEIRKAIYHSESLKIIEDYVKNNKDTEQYKKIFTKNDIKHYKDYGRFYRSIAFVVSTNIDKEVVEDYNSRPRDMINNVLRKIQSNDIDLKEQFVSRIIDSTIKLKTNLLDKDKTDFIIDSFIPFLVDDSYICDDIYSSLQDDEFKETLLSSPGTTSNVNKRIQLVKQYVFKR